MNQPTITSTYSQEYADLLCATIATTPSSLNKIVDMLRSEDNQFPCVRTIYSWLRLDSNFAECYSRAKSDQMDVYAEELIDIVDDDSGDEGGSVAVQRSKLRAETRKWLMSKIKVKKYGDRLDISSKVDVQHKIAPVDLSQWANRVIEHVKPVMIQEEVVE